MERGRPGHQVGGLKGDQPLRDLLCPHQDFTLRTQDRQCDLRVWCLKEEPCRCSDRDRARQVHPERPGEMARVLCEAGVLRPRFDRGQHVQSDEPYQVGQHAPRHNLRP
jgi:hypothetical protein